MGKKIINPKLSGFYMLGILLGLFTFLLSRYYFATNLNSLGLFRTNYTLFAFLIAIFTSFCFILISNFVARKLGIEPLVAKNGQSPKQYGFSFWIIFILIMVVIVYYILQPFGLGFGFGVRCALLFC